MVFASSSAFSQTLDDALTKFSADSFGQTEDGINAAAATGSPRALAVIEALQAGQLFFDPASKRIFIRQGANTYRRRDWRRCDSAPPPISSRCASTTVCAAPLKRHSARSP